MRPRNYSSSRRTTLCASALGEVLTIMARAKNLHWFITKVLMVKKNRTQKKEKNHFRLYRNNEPYFIKGAGGYTYYEKLKECGGNSVLVHAVDAGEPWLSSCG